MNFLELTQNKLDLNEINSLLVHETCGGISFFVGTTRDSFEDRKIFGISWKCSSYDDLLNSSNTKKLNWFLKQQFVKLGNIMEPVEGKKANVLEKSRFVHPGRLTSVVSLEYEAYEAMAKKTLNEICEHMRSKWTDIKHIAIYHRLGLVPVKEASVIIGVSSPHRGTSLNAVQYAIEELKKSVPIWKKERYSDPEANRNTKRDFSKLNFDDCQVDDEPLPKYMVQIGADVTEVQRRVTRFIERKREEIDENNIRDFIDSEMKQNTDEENSCARVNSIVFRKGSHLKVHRVKNEYGPQTNIGEYSGALDKLMTFTSPIKIKTEMPDGLPSRIGERLANAEEFLNLKPNDTRNIYARIKSIEDRILHLETLSPEYHHFLEKGTSKSVPKMQKKVYSVAELDKYIQRLGHRNN